MTRRKTWHRLATPQKVALTLKETQMDLNEMLRNLKSQLEERFKDESPKCCEQKSCEDEVVRVKYNALKEFILQFFHNSNMIRSIKVAGELNADILDILIEAIAHKFDNSLSTDNVDEFVKKLTDHYTKPKKIKLVKSYE